MENNLIDYLNMAKEILIPMVISIFVLAFPLLIQTISRIDDKYNSTKLIETFKKDGISKMFLWTLISAIVCSAVTVFQFVIFSNSSLLINSFTLIFIATTLTLIIMTFLIVYLIYIYYVPQKLFNRLKIKHNKTKKDEKRTIYFEAIGKVLFYSINKADENLARDLFDFYDEAFENYRKEREGKEIIYPNEYYTTVFEAHELLCNRKRKTISFFENSTLFDLFFDGYYNTSISSNTYKFLWNLLLQSVLHDKDNFILSYWENANQIYYYNWDKSYPKQPNTKTPDANQKEIERKDFLEFHYALGALLLYKQKYKTLKNIMFPPNYVLVPEKMEDIIMLFKEINRKDFPKSYTYHRKYMFPDSYGAGDINIFKTWFRRYVAILFLRQYKIDCGYVKFDYLAMPKLPKSLRELNLLITVVDSLKQIVNEYLSNKDVLKELGLEDLHDEDWFEQNNKIKPSDLLSDYQTKIQDNINNIKTNQSLSIEKEIEFKNATINTLEPLFKIWSEIFQNPQMGTGYDTYNINGKYLVLDKIAFADNQDVNYYNTDSVVAQAVASKSQSNIFNFFVMINPDKYLLEEKDMFEALDKLNIEPENFVIMAVCLNLHFYSHSMKIKELKKEDGKDVWSYKNHKIITINNNINDKIDRSLFILKKEDLPKLVFKDTDDKYKNEYNLEKIDDQYNIYAKINDLNDAKNENLKTLVKQHNYEGDLSQKVLVCVDINIEVQYKKAKCIQLKEFSQFSDRGKYNKLEDIKDIFK